NSQFPIPNSQFPIPNSQCRTVPHMRARKAIHIMDYNLIAKIVIFSVSIPFTFYIAYAAKVALNLNLDIFGAGHTPAKLEKLSGGIIKCKWFPNPHHCPGNNHVKE
ncbi:hypothetical protein QT970_13530, partial [Microcoleus sp. herbarium8]|uniref:hypothetical protein n=1 Tax=Microcoleus sp. herbarium8 TaxID=3055436 RepID=UPI002FD549B1